MSRILCKAKSDGDFIRLRAISREHRYPGEFWLHRDRLWDFVRSDRGEYVERDGYNYICLRRVKDEIFVTLTYVNVYANNTISGRQEEFRIHRPGFESFVCVSNIPGATLKALSLNPPARPKIVFERTENLHRVASNPIYRRKLAKFLRDAFLWRCDRIELSNDWDPYSFFFTELFADGKTGICGGVILHGQDDPAKAYYSIHT